MENQSSESLVTEGTFEGEAPGLAGVVGRMRLMVGDQALGVLVVDNGRVKLVPDGPPVDVTAVCKSRDLLIRHPARAAQSGHDGAPGAKAGCTAIASAA